MAGGAGFGYVFAPDFGFFGVCPLLLTALNDNQDDELFPLTLAASRSHL